MSLHVSATTFAGLTLTEALRYGGGYIIRKSAHYDFFGQKEVGDISWTGAISTGNFKIPNKAFFTQLRQMENMYVSYHGEKGLKAW